MVSLASIVFVIGCDNDDDDAPAVSCEQAVRSSVELGTAYAQTPTKASCEKYKEAIQQILNSCPTYTTQQKDAFKAQIDLLDCDTL